MLRRAGLNVLAINFTGSRAAKFNGLSYVIRSSCLCDAKYRKRILAGYPSRKQSKARRAACLVLLEGALSRILTDFLKSHNFYLCQRKSKNNSPFLRLGSLGMCGELKRWILLSVDQM